MSPDFGLGPDMIPSGSGFIVHPTPTADGTSIVFADVAPAWSAWRPWRGRTSRWWFEVHAVHPPAAVGAMRTSYAYLDGGSGGAFTLRRCVQRAQLAVHRLVDESYEALMLEAAERLAPDRNDGQTYEPLTPDGAHEFAGRWLIGESGTNDRILREAAQHIYALLDRDRVSRLAIDDAIFALTHLLKSTGKPTTDDVIRRVFDNVVPRLHAALRGENPYADGPQEETES